MTSDVDLDEVTVDDIYSELTMDEYLEKSTLIPVYEQLQGKNDRILVASVQFVPNLNRTACPSYLNDSGSMGLIRVTRGKLKNKLIFMFEHEYNSKGNYAEIISENDAYELCILQGKYNLIKRFDIKPDHELIRKYEYLE